MEKMNKNSDVSFFEKTNIDMIKQTLQDLRDAISLWLGLSNKNTMTSLSKQCKISRQSISAIMNDDDYDPSLSTINKILDIIGES